MSLWFWTKNIIDFVYLPIIFTLVVGEVKCNMANGDRNKQSNAKANHSQNLEKANCNKEDNEFYPISLGNRYGFLDGFDKR